jgi:hypothetical protein
MRQQLNLACQRKLAIRSVQASKQAIGPPRTVLARRQPIRRCRCPQVFARPPRAIRQETERRQSATVPLLNSLSKPFRPLCCESRRLGQIDDILQTDGPKNRGGRPVTIAVLSAHGLLRYASPWTIKRVQMHVQRQGWSGIRQGMGENSNSRLDLMRLGQGSPDRHTSSPFFN